MDDKKSKADLYFADIEKWENGELGDSEEFDKPSIMDKELRELIDKSIKPQALAK